MGRAPCSGGAASRAASIANEAYGVRDFVIMSPLTTRVRHIPTEVELGPEDGLARSSIANLDVIITESKGCLRERITLGPGKLHAVDTALRFALGLQQ